MKLGKLPASPSPHDFKLSLYAPTLPTPPARFGHGTLYVDWGMLGNDNWGDCVFAGGAHETMLYARLGAGRRNVTFSPACVLADYGAVTGFDPADPNSDNGTEVRQALSYRRKTGLADAAGSRHRIGAYVSIPPKDWEKLMQAVYVFGAVGIGFEFPASAMDQFNADQHWDVVPGSPIEGGHYVPVVGSMTSTKRATCLTWGRRQEFTRAFYERYNDEAWAILSPEILSISGLGLHGFNVAQLTADLAALRA